MDLSEAHDGQRHPWELSRLHSVESIVRKHGATPPRSILDWGCGDGFMGKSLFERFGAERLVGVDVHFDDERSRALAAGDPRMSFVRDESAVPDRRFDLVLLCDVIEHVEDDRALLANVAARHVSEHGRVVVTVPAFQSLFSSHDVALRHYRRYNLNELLRTVRAAGLEPLASGYLFGSLLPARALTRVAEALRPPKPQAGEIGLARWRGGKVATALISSWLRADNAVLMALAERGVKAPGLSVWACCRA
jgi:2-polyprenyl-3-methyl-5-hydroxy-6-metoxy-1,4-benzoquinol methylase